MQYAQIVAQSVSLSKSRSEGGSSLRLLERHLEIVR
jgi:hypothetical protein